MNFPNEADHSDYSIFLARIAEQNRNKISPIRLVIDCEALRQWGESHERERFRYQNLVKELKLWGALLTRRPVRHLELNNPCCFVDSPSLIELVQAVNHYLKVPSRGQTERAVILPPKDVNKQNAVLLKALRFNHVRIKIEPAEPLERVMSLLLKLTEWKVERGSVLIDNGQNKTAEPLHVTELLSACKPASVGFIDSLNLPAGLDNGSMTTTLMRLGYYLSPGNVIMRFCSTGFDLPIDCIRLGPAAQSHFGSWNVSNHSEPAAYYLSLNQSRLPVATEPLLRNR